MLLVLKDIASSVMFAAEAETPSEVLRRIAEAARELVGARYAALGVPNGIGGLRVFEFSGMTEEQVMRVGPLPKGHGLLGEIMHEREAVIVDNIAMDPRSSGFPAHHPRMSRFLGVPIQLGEQLFGMLYLTDRKDGKPFDDSDLWLIELLAGYAALAIAGAELREQRQRLTLLEERERIAMELHDGIIQSLYAIGMHVELMRSAEHVPSADLKPIVHSLNEVIEDIRDYIKNLKARSLSQKTIHECLGDVVHRLHVPPSLDVELDVEEMAVPLNPSIFEAVYQMTNEALSNVIRHANATRVRLHTRRRDKAFVLMISDNGQGFDLATMPEVGGLGLHNMQQRARLHGGSVDIQSEPGKGTTVTLTIPVP